MSFWLWCKEVEKPRGMFLFDAKVALLRVKVAMVPFAKFKFLCLWVIGLMKEID